LVDGAPLIGHFGTCNPLVAPVLESVIEQMCASRSDLRFALLGRGTEAFARRLSERGRIHPSAIALSGERPEPELSRLLQCCDVFVQPYPDGVSSRRTTMMALLQHGCVVVASVGARTEACWRESDVVRLTPPGDATAMAAAALALLDESATGGSIRERARAAYLTHFDAGRAVDALVDRTAV
jgi:glycosyltransferase involved in cell wall biosynthesis